jgi:uncharacterized RDD family membrane protein YckC
MFCTKCGASVADNTAFCPSCGTPLAVLSAPAPLTSPPISLTPGSYAAPPAAFAPVIVSPYAGFWLRLVAYVIDGIILDIVIGVPLIAILLGSGVLAGLSAAANNNEDSPQAILALLFSGFFLVAILIAFVVIWLYSAYLESSTWQATIGKKALGLVVTDLEGQRLSFGRATGRFFAKMVSGFIPLAIGFIMAGFTERKQALHDFIAGTLVLRKN